MVLLSLGLCATLTAMLSYKIRKVTSIRRRTKSFGYAYGSYFCGDDDHSARTRSCPSPDNDVRNCFRLVGIKVKLILRGWMDLRQAQPAVDRKFNKYLL